MADNKIAARIVPKINFNIKISRRTLGLLGVGACVVIACVLVGYRNGQVAEQTRLRDELTIVKNRLAALGLDQLSVQQNELLKQTSLVNDQLMDLENQVATPVNSIDASDKLFAIAKDSGIVITKISADNSYNEVLNNIACTVLPVTVSIEGDWLKMTDFITRLKTDFIICSVKNVDMIVSEDTSASPSIANLNLLIYTYRGN